MCEDNKLGDFSDASLQAWLSMLIWMEYSTRLHRSVSSRLRYRRQSPVIVIYSLITLSLFLASDRTAIDVKCTKTVDSIYAYRL